MNIHLNYFCSCSVSFLKQRVLPILTEQQKKIIFIASIALSCLAACYFITRCCIGSGSKSLSDEESQNLADQLHEDTEIPSTISLEDKLEMARKAGRFLITLYLADTKVTDQQLQEIVKSCPNLKGLDLRGCKELTNAVIKNLPKNLEVLNLSACEFKLTEATFKDFKKLRMLDLSRCYELTDEAIKSLPEDLRELDLSGCHKLTDIVAKNLPQDLETLSLRGCDKLTDKVVEDLPKKLRTLDISELRELTDAAIEYLPKNLEVLDLSLCKKLTDIAIKNLPKDLKRLGLVGCEKSLINAAFKDLPHNLFEIMVFHAIQRPTKMQIATNSSMVIES